MIIINIIAILLSPVIAVCITLWWQHRQEKLSIQHQIFRTLMAHRKSYPPAQDWAKALNLIDIVFHDHPKIKDQWHEVYALLQRHINNANEREEYEHKYLEMLSQIATTLGYSHLQQTDIDKFYTPMVHGQQAIFDEQFQNELMRVLKNTERFLVEKKNT